MKNSYNFFAVDLGATSGRTILGALQNNTLELKQFTRFQNKILCIHDKYYWNIYSLFEEIKKGLLTASQQGVHIDAMGIDTWGVDFVYLAKDGSLLNLPRSYRDPYTNGIPKEYFSHIPRKRVYDLTGIQIMNFNSLFQLYAARKESSSALEYADSILFIPDAFIYLLTAKKICEYTIASTSQLLNPYTKQIESELLSPMNIEPTIIPQMIMPGTVVGNLVKNIQRECNVPEIPVIAVAGHDTASAVVAVPAEDENFAYLSSGTWSLMGIETKNPIITEESYRLNFTNEGGVESTNRFLKNITGMWLLEKCREEWKLEGKNYTYVEIVQMAENVDSFQFLIDPDDSIFSNPESMTQAITVYCNNSGQKVPITHAELIRCIFDSLALKYKYVLNSLQKLSSFQINRLHVIGGGSQNKLLNQLTANAIGLPVIAGPAEATAMGNIMMQAKGLGLVSSLTEIRSIIRNSVNLEIFYPQNTELWEKAYKKYLHILEK
ncbi:MAG TPA: rhamnulokinase family protein [Paludibacteraceae bacterium]|nr:rhamnulokinase family protein [Paludibacteraceae bacterium]HOL01112.1 rhamnulokinase family protein [Paludibacteraceae bacterium]HPO67896.1 rhamnulokinase family protein [Paludibacteraceae bacterium]